MKSMDTEFSTTDRNLMHKALDLARIAALENEVPIGCIIVDRNNVIVGTGFNRKEQQQNPCLHAEMIAIQQASQKLKSWRLIDCKMYVTLEPCLMCAGAIYQSRLSAVIYGCLDPKAGALNSLYSIHIDSRLNHQFKVRTGLLGEESSHLLKSFFKNKRKTSR